MKRSKYKLHKLYDFPIFYWHCSKLKARTAYPQTPYPKPKTAVSETLLTLFRFRWEIEAYIRGAKT
jgi:hypothetical protein